MRREGKSKRASKGDTTRRPITLKGEGSTPEGQARAVESQKQLAYEIAADLERGQLPNANLLQFAAFIVRRWADQLHLPKARKRGNPNFERKVPDDDAIPLMVGFRIGLGDDEQAAIANVADRFKVDESTVAKLFRARREAVADDFVNSNLRHRVGAIRGK